MDNQILERLAAQDKKLDAIYVSTEKTRKYFLITMWVSIALFVLPLIGLLFAIPSFLSLYTSTLTGI